MFVAIRENMYRYQILDLLSISFQTMYIWGDKSAAGGGGPIGARHRGGQ